MGLEKNIIQDMGLGSKGSEHDKVEFGFYKKRIGQNVGF
jgi:hypothetical protein